MNSNGKHHNLHSVTSQKQCLWMFLAQESTYSDSDSDQFEGKSREDSWSVAGWEGVNGWTLILNFIAFVGNISCENDKAIELRASRSSTCRGSAEPTATSSSLANLLTGVDLAKAWSEWEMTSEGHCVRRRGSSAFAKAAKTWRPAQVGGSHFLAT